MSFLPTTNTAGCLAGIYLTNAVVAPLAIFYNVSIPRFHVKIQMLTGTPLVDHGQRWR